MRYADGAVLVADKRKKLQKMIDRLSETCREYGMEINIKKDQGDGNEWKGKDEQEATVCDVGWSAFGTGDSF